MTTSIQRVEINHPHCRACGPRIQELKAQCHSCLTCNYTKQSYGTLLKCELKSNKFVKYYNICEHHTPIVPNLHRETEETI